MSQTVHGCRSNQQRHRDWQTEHTGAGITMRHINQHPWTQANTREIGLIGAQGHLVIAAAGIIIPRGRVYALLCQELVIKHVEWIHMSFLSTAGVPIGVPPETKGAIPPVTNLSIPDAERFSQSLMGRFLCFAPMRLHDASQSVQIVPNVPHCLAQNTAEREPGPRRINE
jgi:hypothetical protein